MHLEKLNVFLQFSDAKIPVGQFVLDGKEVLFKYSASYLNAGWNISPLKLSFDQKIQMGPMTPFRGLFGVFADSLPDAWGQLIMKRQLSRRGIAIETLNSLEYLAYVGNNGLGALSYIPSFTESTKPKSREVDLDILSSNAQAILQGASTEIVDHIFTAAGSPGGARPKMYVGFNPVDDSLISGTAALPSGYEHWIIKFGTTNDATDNANIEMAYHRMAIAAGIEMNECRLFSGKSGRKYFGTRRFDRVGNSRLHMISAAGLFHDDYERSQLDYGMLMQEGSRLVGSIEVASQVLRLAAFNIFAHNRDDHSKNFAFLMDGSGTWKFAPAFDLTFSSSSQGQHSTTCAGNGVNPGTKELYELIQHFSIRNGKEIVKQVKFAVGLWAKFARQAKVSRESMNLIGKVIQLLKTR